MGYVNTSKPSWHTFGVAIAVVVFLCVVSVKVRDPGWLSSSYGSHLSVLESYTSARLEPWERNTLEEYALKLSTVRERSHAPGLRYYEFNVSSVTTAVGGIHRELLLINAQYPGPLIEAVQGDTIVVTVANNIETAESVAERVTSLHFHGQYMNTTNFYDGSVGLTQCGIRTGKSFTYAFVVDHPGTYWYHSHWDLQQIEGLVGPMVVHERIKDAANFGSQSHDDANMSRQRSVPTGNSKPGDIAIGNEHEGQKVLQSNSEVRSSTPSKDSDIESARDNDSYEEVVLFLSDLYNRPAADLLLDYVEPWIGGVDEPIPDIALAQGKIRPVIELSNGGKIRVRIINACSYTAFNVKIQNRSMTVIEADSTPVQPTIVQSLLIYPAQRYSVVLDLEDSASAWIETVPQSAFYGTDPNQSQQLIKSSGALKTLLVVKNETAKLPLASHDIQLRHEGLVEPYFQPSKRSTAASQDSTADFEHTVDITMTRLTNGAIAGALNSRFYERAQNGNLLNKVFEAYDLRMKGNQRITHSKYDLKAEALFQFDDIRTVDIVIRNFDDGPHPVHIHGLRMWIISRGSLSSMETTWKSLNPLDRDTVWLPENQWVRVRLLIDNPGVWAIHCHIPWHSRIGMKGSILALPAQLAEQKPPPDWYELCEH